jgi:hypothetical protein
MNTLIQFFIAPFEGKERTGDVLYIIVWARSLVPCISGALPSCEELINQDIKNIDSNLNHGSPKDAKIGI